jgi:polysaccharide biosynthesis/export protein
MFALLQIAVLCVVTDADTACTVHFRELTAPERVVRMPLAGSETVLDAIAALKQSPTDLARMDLWVARPGASGSVRVLRIDWTGIARRGVTATNYQLLAGDRLFLQARPAE